ncbi:MAG: thymidylate synthase [Deltaproteobacteria bacterium]|nr:thymidylate synthase [Deltaproteobacteria bacterium]
MSTTTNFTPLNIEATTLPDAWFQTVYTCIERGRDFTIDRGSYAGQKRLEFDYITAHIKFPGSQPQLPQIPGQYNLPNPVADDYLDDYLPYLMTGAMKPGESYTYGQRICKYPLPDEHQDYAAAANRDILISEKEVWQDRNIIVEENGRYYLNQIELLIWTYKNKGHRNNQMVLQVAHPTDMLLLDPPCLRAIDTRIQDGKLHFIISFRSWDLWGGFPANLAGIQQMKEYIASMIGVEDGEIIAASKGLHLYNYVWELAEMLRGKTIDEFRQGK